MCILGHVIFCSVPVLLSVLMAALIENRIDLFDCVVHCVFIYIFWVHIDSARFFDSIILCHRIR